MEAMLAILREVHDPRSFNARHDCASMLFIALMATLCGAKSCVDIADFAEVNEEDLRELVDLPHGAPSHDSFSRLFGLLDPDEMAQSFERFAQTLREGLGLGPPKGVIAIDGKRMRRGYERGKVSMPPLMIGVWDTQTRVSIAACAALDGNEVGATLKVLKNLDLKGCIVTADALHCHPKMAQAVLAAGAHYALKLKANNGPLHDAAIEAFEKADASGKLAVQETRDQGHDRIERRCGSVVKIAKGTLNLPGLTMFGRIESERQVAGGAPTTFTHYIALSKRMSIKEMMETVRMYWGVENQLHWPLDVVFNEDNARTRKNHAPANLSFLRRMALDILKSHPDKRSPARKMKLACWSKEFFFELFTHMR